MATDHLVGAFILPKHGSQANAKICSLTFFPPCRSYISYITCQCLLIGYKLVPPSKFMGCCVTIWGIAAILQGAAFNWSGLMAARFFIGMSEAGYGTGVALYLSFFYPRDEIGVRFAGFVVGSTIASAIAGSIAYGLQSAHASIDSWRLICACRRIESVRTSRGCTARHGKVTDLPFPPAAMQSSLRRPRPVRIHAITCIPNPCYSC